MSTTNFTVFAEAVRNRFIEMSKDKLFVVDADRDEIWTRYLGAFPPGTNPVFRERSEHDCSCCRHFIRSVGNVVAVQNGALTSIWDLAGLLEPYQVVADAMSEYVRGLEICDVFLTSESQHGVEENHERTESGEILTWNHFSVDVPPRLVAHREVVRQKCGNYRTTHQMLMRAVQELDTAAVETVVDLIGQNAIYRGEEHLRAVLSFQKAQARLLATPDDRQSLVAWTLIDEPAARFRNTVIGTLVQDLSEGVDLERAVKSYEAKVAPENYKRPTKLITKKMVEDAMATIRDLNLEPALERRHARLEDVSVNSVLFVDNHVRSRLRGSIEDALMEEVNPATGFNPDRAEDIGISDFITQILPRANSVEVYLENDNLKNFVSLTAPVHDDAASLFRWDNNFAWSYEGDVADSIKERVKRAGGRVEGVALRASLAWSNYDDLDIHVREPDGTHIFYAYKYNKLDVDMNAGGHRSREPVENVRWTGRLRDGRYEVWVEQYQKRESVDVGFEVEIESAGGVSSFRYEKVVRQGERIPVAEITVSGGAVTEVAPSDRVIGGASSREQWGLETRRLHRVNSIILSPNYWSDPGVGNRHWFFILEGCRNPLPTRGIYNEFLSSALEKHRRVFEVLGEKTKCPPSDQQMSGVGFSSTRRDKVAVVVTGQGLNKAYNVKF